MTEQVSKASIEIWLTDPTTKTYFNATQIYHNVTINASPLSYLDADSNTKTMNEIWRRVGVHDALVASSNALEIIGKANLLAKEEIVDNDNANK